MFYAYSYILPNQQKIRVKEENIKKRIQKSLHKFCIQDKGFFLVKKIQ